MSAAEEQIGHFYRCFGVRAFNVLNEFVAEQVFYRQFNYMPRGSEVSGRLEVVGEFAKWGTWFEGLKIDELRITSRPGAIGKVSGAAYCGQALYRLSGRHVKSIPGLITPPLEADGRHKELVVMEVVWLNSHNKILGISGSFRVIMD